VAARHTIAVDLASNRPTMYIYDQTMANTMLLRRDVEDYVRGVLVERHHQAFEARRMRLRSGGTHEFDAVSADRRIVVSIKSASGLTAAGKNPSGKIKDCIAELYFLSLVDAPVRALILTTPEFHQLFVKQMVGAVAEGLRVECCPLPAELQEQVNEVVRQASVEVSPARIAADVAVDVESEIT
jgi:hypothetical protein